MKISFPMKKLVACSMSFALFLEPANTFASAIKMEVCKPEMSSSPRSNFSEQVIVLAMPFGGVLWPNGMSDDSDLPTSEENRQDWLRKHTDFKDPKIGRASCRERV